MSAQDGHSAPSYPRVPPVAEVAIASMALIIVGGIYFAAHLPRHAPSGLPIGLLIAASLLAAANVVMLSRLSEFAWGQFWLVASRVLLAYLVITGMLEYVFVLDHTRGSQLVLVTLMLAVFAVDVPTLMAFTVARYQPVTPTTT